MFRITLPALGNTFVSLFKDTSVASVIAVPELTYGAQWINANTFRIVEVYAVVTPMYLVTGYVILLVLRLLERRFAVAALRPWMSAISTPAVPDAGPAASRSRSRPLVVALLARARRAARTSGLVYGPRAGALGDARLTATSSAAFPILVLIFFDLLRPAARSASI